MRYLVTINNQFEEDLGFTIEELGDIVPKDDRVRQFLDQFTILGKPTASKIWVVIVMYHENTFPEDEPELSTFVFAETEEEAKQLLKTHPTYLEDIETAVIDKVGFTREELTELDVIEYILGDYGSSLSQCVGNFGPVPDEWHPLIKGTLL